MNQLEDRIQSEAMTSMRIENSNLVCRDCANRFDDSVRMGNTSVCSVFPAKPGSVLNGGKCSQYSKEG